MGVKGVANYLPLWYDGLGVIGGRYYLPGWYDGLDVTGGIYFLPVWYDGLGVIGGRYSLPVWYEGLGVKVANILYLGDMIVWVLQVADILYQVESKLLTSHLYLDTKFIFQNKF